MQGEMPFIERVKASYQRLVVQGMDISDVRLNVINKEMCEIYQRKEAMMAHIRSVLASGMQKRIKAVKKSLESLGFPQLRARFNLHVYLGATKNPSEDFLPERVITQFIMEIEDVGRQCVLRTTIKSFPETEGWKEALKKFKVEWIKEEMRMSELSKEKNTIERIKCIVQRTHPMFDMYDKIAASLAWPVAAGMMHEQLDALVL